MPLKQVEGECNCCFAKTRAHKRRVGLLSRAACCLNFPRRALQTFKTSRSLSNRQATFLECKNNRVRMCVYTLYFPHGMDFLEYFF